MKTVIVIPAYQPDERLKQLVKELQYEIVVVNDGSGDKYEDIFSHIKAIGATVLCYDENCGKGHALKTAFQYIMDTEHEFDDIQWVVSVDADGQHTPRDIKKIITETVTSEAPLVIGSRKFVGYVPFRSKLGNALASWLFKKYTGYTMTDTQSGLRAYRKTELPFFCEVEGERYEYEMNCLLHLCGKYQEVPIETVYEKGNKRSHYRAVADTVRIGRILLEGKK